MPYRIKRGQMVRLGFRSATASMSSSADVPLKRTIDLTKKDIIASPLKEHWDEGISRSHSKEWPWQFNVRGMWDVGTYAQSVEILYAHEVHVVNVGTGLKANTIVVQGSGTSEYTILLDNDGIPIKCSCPGFRFNRGKPCKHMRKVG